MHYSYLFEAHTIQKYILDSGKLKEMVGASEILESLTGEHGPLDSLLANLNLRHSDDYVFSRRGGGAFYLLFSGEKAYDNAKALMNIWTFVVNELAPGLEFNHAIAHGDTGKEAIEAAKTRLREMRNQPQAGLPEATPLVRRSPRTGMPVIKKAKEQAGFIWLDAASVEKRKDKYAKGEALSKKFLPDNNSSPEFVFPRNLEPEPDKKEAQSSFPFKNGNHTIGIIHADGNGLGEVLLKLGEDLDAEEYAKVFFDLSQKIDKATRLAAQEALEPIKEACLQEWQNSKDAKEPLILPVRPLILGGDDLTVIVRGDYALQFARDFIESFEKKTKQELEQLHNDYPVIPELMTACAGITLLKANQPFSLGYALAESLCSAAKTASRALKQKAGKAYIPGSLVFHRVTSSFIDDYSFAKERELSVKLKDSNKILSLTLGAYGVGEFARELPAFDTLKSIKELFQKEEMSKGPTRHFLTLLRSDPNEAEEVWRRWEKGMKSDSKRQQILDEFNQLVSTLFDGQWQAGDMPFRNLGKDEETNSAVISKETFIGDLINWMAAEGETHAN